MNKRAEYLISSKLICLRGQTLMKFKWICTVILMVWAFNLNSVLNASLVGHWRFDGDLKDSIANNDGTANGNVFVEEDNGILGGAAEFDGSGDFIVIPTPSLPGTTWSLTWWSFSSAGSSNTGYMVASGNPEGFEAIFFRRYGPEVYAGGVTQDTNVTPRISLGEPGPYPRGIWHHHAVLHDGNTSTAYWYIDGNLWIDTNPANTNKTNFTRFDEVIYVGNRKSGGRDFEGKIDDLRLYNQVLTVDQIQEIMNGEGSGFPLASNPNPPDGTLHEDTWINLSWWPGDLAASHDVYLGDNLRDVEEATRDSELYRGNQISTFYVAGFPGFAYPDGLVPGTTYYWRIDEVNDAEPNSPWKGDIWNFSIPPKTAYNPDPTDGAEFVATDATLNWTPGFGAKLHTVYIGTDHDTVNNAAGGLPQGTADYKPAAPLEEERVYYWRVDEFDAVATYKGDVWGFTTPGAAGSLEPANGAVDVQINSTLSWTPAATAVSHDLYFGTDKDTVKNATSASPEFKGNKAKGSESYDLGKLAWHSDYYSRIDAVYNTGTVKGLVWSFTTADFLLVDDFESYNDIDPPDPNSNRIFESWIDGFGTTDNGALVGNDMPPYAEQAIVHGGNQSMIYRYDNSGKTSEATLTLVSPRDWTQEGITKLSLWYRGASSNAADKVYVVLNGTAVMYRDDPAATQKTGWNQWVIDLQAFADQGVNLTNVNTITIGIGTKGSPAAGGTGTMYFDDIRLYRP